MAADTTVIRQKLTQLLTQDSYLSRVFPSTGNIERAKLSRARLLLKNAKDNNVDLSTAIEAAVAIEVVHLATLVHDDVIDDSPMRRNSASFKASHGNKSAVLYGDYLFSLAVNHVQTTQNGACASVFTECIHDTCRGEAIQDLMLSSPDFSPRTEDLFAVARGKTGALFAFCTQAPALIRADTPEVLQAALKEIGY
jgi:geranylgeranyl pyrophosphate synthase